jgi:hypothetical protein
MTYGTPYTFEAFRADIKARVRMLNDRLEHPAATWPGVLFLDVTGGLTAHAYELGATADERERLANETLPAEIGARRARRFCWAMPAWRDDGRRECLLLVFGEPGVLEATLADVWRDGRVGPRLGPFRDGAYGGGARRVSGRFVEPLAAAIAR